MRLACLAPRMATAPKDLRTRSDAQLDKWWAQAVACRAAVGITARQVLARRSRVQQAPRRSSPMPLRWRAARCVPPALTALKGPEGRRIARSARRSPLPVRRLRPAANPALPASSARPQLRARTAPRGPTPTFRAPHRRAPAGLAAQAPRAQRRVLRPLIACRAPSRRQGRKAAPFARPAPTAPFRVPRVLRLARRALRAP